MPRRFVLIVARVLQMVLYLAAFCCLMAFSVGSVAAEFGPNTAAWLVVLGLLLFVGQTYLPRKGL